MPKHHWNNTVFKYSFCYSIIFQYAANLQTLKNVFKKINLFKYYSQVVYVTIFIFILKNFKKDENF